MDLDDRTDPVPPPRGSAATLLFAIVFELSLGGISLVIGWVIGLDPLRTLPPLDEIRPWLTGSGVGLVAATPLLLGMLLVDQSRHPALDSLRAVVDQSILPLFKGVPLSWLALISLAAGVGEEVLCRGLIQSGLAGWWRTSWGDLAAWIVTGILFGLAHSITQLYAVFAIIVGLYLGALFWWSGNLWVPIVTHAAYDFAALVYLLNTRSLR